RASHLNCHLDGHIAQPPQVSARAEVRGRLARAAPQLFEFDFLGHWLAPYWTATSVNRTSLTFTSVEFRIAVRILCFSLSRWLESMSAVLFWLVRMFTMRSRINASSGRVPTSPEFPEAASAVAPLVWPGAR